MLFHSNKSIYLLTTLGRLAIEGSLAWRASVVWFFVLTQVGTPAPEAYALQAIAGLGIFAFGFGLAQGRSRALESLEERYKKRGMSTGEIRTRMEKARKSAGWLIAFVILNDIAGAVYLGAIGAQGAPAIAQIAIIIMLSALSGAPFLGNEFFHAMAEMIPHEGLQNLLNLGLQKNMKIKLNALDRLADQANNLPPDVVLGETWDELMLAATSAGSNYSTAFGQLKALAPHVQRAEEERKRKIRENQERGLMEDGDGDDDEEEQPTPAKPKVKDWITAEHRTVELNGKKAPAQLPPASEQLHSTFITPDESESAAAGPFGHGASSPHPGIPNEKLEQLIQQSQIAPAILYQLLMSKQLERMLLNRVPGQESAWPPTEPELPERKLPVNGLLSLAANSVVPAPQLLQVVQERKQLAELLRAKIEE